MEEVAERLKVNAETVRGLFMNEPGAIILCHPRKGRRVYRTEGGGHTVEVTTEPRPCSDAMSGKRYAETVLLTLDGKSYDGCGRKID